MNMRKQKVHAYRYETSSLSSLKMVLTNARRSLPPRIANQDASDGLALRLIENMKAQYKKHFRYFS
jgi:hypothetical protein